MSARILAAGFERNHQAKKFLVSRFPCKLPTKDILGACFLEVEITMSLSAQLAGLWRQAKGWIAGRVPANTENGSVEFRSVTRTPAQPANLYPSPAQTASAESAGTQPARLSGEGLAGQKATEERWAALFSDEPINQSGAATQVWPQTDEDIARVERIKAQKTGRKLVFFEDEKGGDGTGATQRTRTIPFGNEHKAPDTSVTSPTPSDDEKKQREREAASAAIARRVQEQTEGQQRQIEQMHGTGNAAPQAGVSEDRKKRILKFLEDQYPTPTRNDPEHTRRRSRTLSR